MNSLRFISAFVRIFDFIERNKASITVNVKINEKILTTEGSSDILQFADELDFMQQDIDNVKRGELNAQS